MASRHVASAAQQISDFVGNVIVIYARPF